MVRSSGDFESIYRGRNEATTVGTDAALALLADARRRTVLRTLVATPESVVDMETVITAIIEADPDLSADDRETIAIECHHALFPKLSSAGVVDYDSNSGTLAYHRSPIIEILLDRVTDVE